MSSGGHFNSAMVHSFGFDSFNDATPKQKEEIVNVMNIIHMNNDKENLVMGDKEVFELAKSIVLDGKTRVYPTKANPNPIMQNGGRKESAIKMKNKVIIKQDKENKVENISVKCGKQTKTFECPLSGGAESYIAVSTNISKKLVDELKIPYKPAIMQKMLSIYRKKSSATDAITQLKDANKYIREHKDEFVKKYKQAIKATEKSSTQSGGGESYITVSTNISKKLVNDFKIPYKPAIMQKMLSIYRQKSSATDAVAQLKDANKYIREHKDEFIKKYEQAIKATEKSSPKSGGAESYITASTNISKKLVEKFKIPYKPAIMQKMLSIYRKKSSATDAITQLKDADKYIREHKDEFIKKYEQAIKATEKSEGKK